MTSRYNSANIIDFSRKIESDGNVKLVRRLKTTIYPSFEEAFEDDTYILSQQGDRLDLLAKEFYGDETYWYVIAKVNGIGHGTLAIPPGVVIRVPYFNNLDAIASEIYRFNRER